MKDSSDLADDLVPNEPKHTYHKREFAPWHKARKEYIRKNQWNELILRYMKRALNPKLQSAPDPADKPKIDSNAVEVRRPLSCLLIPGDDLLDVRALIRDTEKENCYVRYLGFNKGQGSDKIGTRVHIAHNDITTSNRVLSDSVVIPDRIEMVSRRSSLASQYLKQLGPFHVVNLDLCESFFPYQTGEAPNYYKALHAITNYQMQNMVHPWLLFITTEVAPKETNFAELDKLCTPTKKNVSKYTEFLEELNKTISLKSTLKVGDELNLKHFSESDLVDLFVIALGKALLDFCASTNGDWIVEMRGSHRYTVNESKNVGMLSLAYEFTPIPKPAQDGTGLSDLELTMGKKFDELQLAMKILRSVKNITDIDEILITDSEIQETMENSSADLLESAGYDREKYINWLRTN